jgi:hypothetical protein
MSARTDSRIRHFFFAELKSLAAKQLNSGNANPGCGIITQSLQEWRAGDEDALSRLTANVYKELHRMAARFSIVTLVVVSREF